MTPEELRAQLHPGLSWDDSMLLLGRAWRYALKRYDKQPDKLHWAWEELMSIYEETVHVPHLSSPEVQGSSALQKG